MSILTLESKKKREEIPNQRVGESKKKRKENSQSKSGRKRKERKENSKSKKKKRKEKKKKKKERKLLVKETRRNVQRGLWTGQYLNNTELSPNEQKEEKETAT